MSTHQPISFSGLNKAHWYNWQQPACPLLLGGCYEACGAVFRETFGISFFTSILYFRPTAPVTDLVPQGSWLLRLDEGITCGTYLTDLLQIESCRRGVFQEFASVSRRLAQISAAITRSDLPVDISSIANLFDSFFVIFNRFYAIGAITEPVQWRVENVVRRDLLETKYGFTRSGAEWTQEQIKSAAFATEREPYSLEILAHLGRLLNTAEAALGRQGQLSSDQATCDKLLCHAEFMQLVDEHIAAFGWKQNNYATASGSDRERILREVVRIIETLRSGEGKDPRLQVEEARRTREENLKRRVQLLSAVTDYHRRLILIGDEFGSGMADARKRTMLQALGAVECLVAQLAKVSCMDRNVVAMLMPQEVRPFCESPQSFDDRLNRRYHEGFLLIESPFPLLNWEFDTLLAARGLTDSFTSVPPRNGPTYVEAEQIGRTFEELNVTLNIIIADAKGPAVLSGDVAFSGEAAIVQGRVRVVKRPTADEFHPGEVLVATSTTPDFMAQIRIAKAIITDQGGLGTHAALTSRELKIPCIVGTAVGTLKLKSGDLIEMNFRTGHIRLIE